MNEQQSTESTGVPYEAADRKEMWPRQISLIVLVCVIFLILVAVVFLKRRPGGKKHDR